MRTLLKYTVVLSCLAGLASMDAAVAKPRTPIIARFMRIMTRFTRIPVLRSSSSGGSFLDPGTQVPVGSTNQYVWQPAYDWGNDP